MPLKYNKKEGFEHGLRRKATITAKGAKGREEKESLLFIEGVCQRVFFALKFKRRLGQT
jgi:hypothetical protein